jgi:hypothetical protein
MESEMTTALVLTTINVPTVLALYRKCDPDVHFYIIGDRKTPDAEVCRFLEAVPNHSYYGYDYQAKLGYRSHEALGPDTLSRRNIGFLEALKNGADIIVTIDDDNMPVTNDYFFDYAEIMLSEFNGIKVSGKDGWFDPGQFLVPPVVQRGFPIQVKHRPKFEPVIDAKIGVASGLILGDSDMDAYTRIGKAPTVGDVAMLARTGCVVDPKTYTIFNSQNTCVLREFVPAYFMMPGIGRYDDVYASLIVQRVMRDRGYHVHLGQPLVLQERNEHDPIMDLRAEIEGMAHVKSMADLLDSIILPAKSIIEDTRIIYEQLMHCSFIPEESAHAGLVWLEDVESVL